MEAKMMDAKPTNRSPAAVRMHRRRRRQREGLRHVGIELRETEVDALIRSRLLAPESWAVQAAGLGWGFDELYAIAKPFARVDLQGAAWFIGDCTVVAVSTAAITIRTESGAIQRVYRNKDIKRAKRNTTADLPGTRSNRCRPH
jgi:hypothetical protein